MSKYSKEIRFIDKKTFLWMLILSIIVLFPNIFLACYGNDIAQSSFYKRIAFLVISIFIFLIPSAFLRMREFFLLQGIFVLLAPLEIVHIYLNRMSISPAFLLSIIETDWNESTEVLTSLKLPILFLLFIWFFYFFITLKKVNNLFIFHSIKVRILFPCIFLIILFSGCVSYFYKVYYIDVNIDKKEVFKTSSQKFLTTSFNVYPYGFLINSYKVYNTQKEIKYGRDEIFQFKFHAQKEESIDEREVYIFVIGETCRFKSFSINGYERETSPLLSKTENLISYTDLFSEANVTSSSIPILLTRASARDYNRAFVEKSLVDAFKEAGFKTYWIANQGAGFDYIRRISKDTDGEYFLKTDYRDNNNFDEKLWDYLTEVLKKEEQKVMIVLHTLGSHFRYNFRYPPEFEIFKPCLMGSFDYNMISYKNKEMFVNIYDNSIYYTDFFLAKTIQKLDSLNAVSALTFISDHGENLFDTPEHIVFHAGSKFTEYDLHVPFFVWTSDKYNLQYPEKAENLIRNKDKRLTSDCIFYSFLDLADITFPEQMLAKSIASEKLKEESIRYIINTNMEVQQGF